MRSTTFIDMERPAGRNRLSEPETNLRGQAGRLVVIDEIQRVPDRFPNLRGVIDDRRAGGNTGAASPAVTGNPTRFDTTSICSVR